MGEKRIFQLTEKGIKPSNNYFYLTGNLDFFPDDSLGGSNQAKAGKPLIFRVVGLSEPVESDIDETKPFIRKRFWLQDFIKRHDLSREDEVIIERVSEREYLIYPSIFSEREFDEVVNWSIQQILNSSKVADYKEGMRRLTISYRYERDRNARKECIKLYGSCCFVCKFDFGKTFGAIGDGFIHVHHLTPISSHESEYKVNPVEDLRPVCPNCHAMLHRKSPPYSIEELNYIRQQAQINM